MNLSRKLEMAKTALRSGSRHSDEDANVRKAWLAAIKDFCDSESAAIDAEVAAATAVALAPDTTSAE